VTRGGCNTPHQTSRQPHPSLDTRTAVGPHCSTARQKEICPAHPRVPVEDREQSRDNSGNSTAMRAADPPLERLSVPRLCSLVLVDRQQ
jgi:hypothetical protein